MKSASYYWIAGVAMLLAVNAWSQPSISQSVFAVAGHSVGSPDVYLSSTLGESFIFGGNRDDEYMCQGFQSGQGVMVTAVVQLDHGPQAVTLYPNPVSDFLHIEWENSADYTILIHSLLGQRIIAVPVRNETDTRIDFSEIPSGLYIVSFQLPDGRTRFAGRLTHQL